MKVWNGETPTHTIAVKLDGVQAMLNDKGAVVSRSGKPLFNVDPAHLIPGKKYEVYLGSFSETVSVVRTRMHARQVRKDELFEIWPATDARIVLPFDPTLLSEYFKAAIEQGLEGLVIDQTWKIKKQETHDVEIVGIVPGQGKHAGRMGALVTPMGNVGTGFTDREREQEWRVGDMIEVACMEITADGRFRKPRFLRHRWDKSAPAR